MGALRRGASSALGLRSRVQGPSASLFLRAEAGPPRRAQGFLEPRRRIGEALSCCVHGPQDLGDPDGVGHRRASGSSLFRLSECPSGAATDSLGRTLASEWMKVIFFNPSMKCPKLLAFLWLPMMVVLGVRGRERNVSKRRERGWSERRKGGQVAPEVGAPGPSPRCCDGQLTEGPPRGPRGGSPACGCRVSVGVGGLLATGARPPHETDRHRCQPNLALLSRPVARSQVPQPSVESRSGPRGLATPVFSLGAWEAVPPFGQPGSGLVTNGRMDEG